MDVKYTAVIVEDESHQLETLQRLINKHFPQLSTIGIVRSVPEARELLQKITPDLVFMDVMLPPFTSFDLLKEYEKIPFEIIFTTSFEEYAVKAFRLSAVDYLVKPIVEEDFQRAINNFKMRKASGERTMQLENLLSNMRELRPRQARIALPTLNGFLFLAMKDIIRCEADNTYTTFFTVDKRKIVVSRTLKECEQMMTEHGFFRVHQSHLINMDYVKEYVRGDGGVVTMTDGSQVDVSRRKKEEFIRMINSL